MAIINDFKAIKKACDDISKDILKREVEVEFEPEWFPKPESAMGKPWPTAPSQAPTSPAFPCSRCRGQGVIESKSIMYKCDLCKGAGYV
jgi:hypothetical protein